MTEKQKINSAMIFAAGLGTRMRPLTENTPKPLIDFGGKKLIDYTTEMLQEAGIENIAINSFYLSEQIDNYFNKNDNITISKEAERLETGGGLKNALPMLNSPYVITSNSDIIIKYTENPINKLIERWNPEEFDILMLVINKENIYGYDGDGDFAIDENNKLHKPDRKDYVFTGLQIINTNILSNYNKKIFSLSEVFNKCLSERKLGAIVHNGEAFHIGDIKALELEKKFTLNNE